MNLEAPLTAPDYTGVIFLISVALYACIGTCLAAYRAARQFDSDAYFWRNEIIGCWVCFWPFIGAWLVVSWPFKLLFNAVERQARRRIKR